MEKVDKKESINFTLRMSMEQKIYLERIALEQDRTVTNLINVILKQYIQEWREKNKSMIFTSYSYIYNL